MKVTIKNFKTWLQTKNPDEGFDYCSNDDCCFAQFLKETGICETPYVVPYYWGASADEDAENVIPAQIQSALNGVDAIIGDDSSDTFGAVLKRLA